jgi:hypothetical protein
MEKAIPKNEGVYHGLTVSDAWGHLLRNPNLFIRQWNYKGAVMSGLVRAPFFFFSVWAGGEGVVLALAIGTIMFAFRFVFAGIGGAMIQALRRVEPPWKALLSILVVIPFISHVFEFAIQAAFASATKTESQTLPAVLKSVCVSVFSALFTLYIMRRDVLIVGEDESETLIKDFTKFPRLIFNFLAFVPNVVADMFRRGAYLSVIASFLGFAVFSQIIVAAFYKPQLSWTWKGQQVPVLKYYGVCAMILMLMAVTASLIKGTIVRGRKGKL